MNAAAWQWVLSAGLFVLGWAVRDYVLWRRYGGTATVTTGVRGGGAAVAFLIGYAVGGLTWGLYIHFYLFAY
jgi:hypothetical protein